MTCQHPFVNKEGICNYCNEPAPWFKNIAEAQAELLSKSSEQNGLNKAIAQANSEIRRIRDFQNKKGNAMKNLCLIFNIIATIMTLGAWLIYFFVGKR